MRRVLRLSLAAWVGSLVAWSSLHPTAAQEGSSESCRMAYYAAVESLASACAGQPTGTACAGAGAVIIETESGQVVDRPGGTAQLSAVTHLEAAPGDEWSLISLRLPDLIDHQRYATLIVMGAAVLDMVDDPDRLPGAAFTLSSEAEPLCSDLPQPGILVQSAPNSLTLLRVNGVDLAVNGMAVIQVSDGEGLVVSALTRETILAQSGTVVFAGYSAQIVGESAPVVDFYDAAALTRLPVELLPVIEMVSLPGNAIVLQETNLYARPASEAYTNDRVRAGLPVSLFGQDPGGEWVYVRTYEGQTGWVSHSALDIKTPDDLPILEEPPQPPTRPFGPVQGRGLTNAEHANLRSGPGQMYEVVAQVPLNAEVLIYGRSPDGEWLLVETADGTRAWLSALLLSPTTDFTIAELPLPPELAE